MRSPSTAQAKAVPASTPATGAGRLACAALEVCGIEQVRDVGAVADVRERVLERERDRPDLVAEQRLERFEQPKGLERRDSLRRRRRLVHAEAPVVGRERCRPARLESREVPPRRASSSRRSRPQLPSVDDARPLLGEPAERRTELGETELLAQSRRARPELRRARGLGAPERRDAGRERDPGARRVDRVAEAGVESEAAVALGERRPAGRCAGTVTDRGPRASTGAAGSARAGAGPVASRAAASPALQTSATTSPPGPQLKGSATQSIAAARERRVGRIPAAFERPQPGADGRRMARRHHAVGGDGRRPPEREPEHRP